MLAKMAAVAHEDQVLAGYKSKLVTRLPGLDCEMFEDQTAKILKTRR